MHKDRELLFHYFHMSPERFDDLLALVRDQIEKKDAAFRKSFPAPDRLAITFWRLVKHSSSFYRAIELREPLYQPSSRKHVKEFILHSKIAI